MTDSFKLKVNPGLVGATPNLSVGTVTTGSSGTNASVQITGTSPDLTIDFTIPQGADGAGNVNATSSFGSIGLLIVSDTTTYIKATTTIQLATINAFTAGTLTAGTSSITTLNIGKATGGTATFGTTTVSVLYGSTLYQNSNPVRIAGKETLFIPAAAMISRTTNGPSVGTYESATNKNMRKTLDFDTSTQEFAQFWMNMPKSWNPSATLTFQPTWSHGTTTTTAGVVWGLAAYACSDGDTIDTAFGTAQTSTDTGGTAGIQYIGPESANITPSGTATISDNLLFQLNRTVADGGDTLAWDAYLHGIKVNIYYNASDDT